MNDVIQRLRAEAAMYRKSVEVFCCDITEEINTKDDEGAAEDARVVGHLGNRALDLEAAVAALERLTSYSEEWHGVYFEGAPCAAYPTHSQALCYASGFSRKGTEIRQLRAKAVLL